MEAYNTSAAAAVGAGNRWFYCMLSELGNDRHVPFRFIVLFFFFCFEGEEEEKRFYRLNAVF